jgi:putative FmdB family regulatory protein
MIRYALACTDCDHAFEAWFASSDAYDKQAARQLVTCPACDGRRVAKQIMAPAVKTAKGKSPAPDPEKMLAAFAEKAREHVAENFDYVGSDFADEARAMYYGETGDRPIWGETTPEEREALKEEGVPALPLPAPFAPKPPKRKSRQSVN